MNPPSPHLRERMRQRQITELEIEEALGNPFLTYPSRDHPDRTVVLGTCQNGRSLKVVIVSDDPDTVITVADRNEED